MKKTTIKEKVAKFFESNQVEKIHTTSDGYLFLQADHAKSHGRTLENKKVETHNRTAPKSATIEPVKSPFLDQSVSKIAEALADKKDIAELQALIEEEKAAEDTRKTAIEAIEARIAALKEENE